MSRLLLESDDTGGLSSRGGRLLGFDAMCDCGHEYGLHQAPGTECVVLDCKCSHFSASPASSSQPDAGDKAPSAAPRRSTAEGADILEFTPAPRMPVATCDERDIARVYTNVENIFDLALSAVQGRIGMIRERVPITHVQSFFDLDEEFAQLKYRYLSRLLEMDRS